MEVTAGTRPLRTGQSEIGSVPVAAPRRPATVLNRGDGGRDSADKCPTVGTSATDTAGDGAGTPAMRKTNDASTTGRQCRRPDADQGDPRRDAIGDGATDPGSTREGHAGVDRRSGEQLRLNGGTRRGRPSTRQCDHQKGAG